MCQDEPDEAGAEHAIRVGNDQGDSEPDIV